MKKLVLLILILFINTLLFISCDQKSNGPDNQEDIFYADGKPESFSFHADTTFITPVNNTIYSFSHTDLKQNGSNLSWIKYYYPDPGPVFNIVPDSEFIVAKNDSFLIEIKSCPLGSGWIVNDGTVFVDNSNNWVNNEVKLLDSAKNTNPDNTVIYIFKFKALSDGKGYISFIEKDNAGNIPNLARGLLIGYNINPLSEMWLNADKIKWTYDTRDNFSTLEVKLSGSTNASRLRILTYGDGITLAAEIPIDKNNQFDAAAGLAFLYGAQTKLKANIELLIYGTFGLPKRILIKNPVNN